VSIGQLPLSHGDLSPLDGNFRIDWELRTLYISATTLTQRPHDRAAILIHEIGHLCACPEAPEFSDEYDFLGWEWQYAKLLGIEQKWRESVSRYGLGQGSDPDLHGTDLIPPDSSLMNEILRERRTYARDTGLLNAHFQPISLLTKRPITRQVINQALLSLVQETHAVPV